MPASTRATRKAEERAAAIEELRAIFPKGSTAYTILRHVSASGMTRDISVIAVIAGEPVNVSYLVSRACNDRMSPYSNHNALRVGGAGMDMGFHVVYGLSATLYGHEDRGGYAVSHRWL